MSEKFRVVWSEPEDASARPVLARPPRFGLEPPSPVLAWDLDVDPEDPDRRFWFTSHEHDGRAVTMNVIRNRQLEADSEHTGQSWDGIVTDTASGYFIHGRDYPSADAAKIWAEYAVAHAAVQGVRYEEHTGPASQDIARNLRERLFAGYPNAGRDA